MGLRACTHETLATMGLPAARASALLPDARASALLRAARASALLLAAAWRWTTTLGGLGVVAEPWSHGAVASVLPISTIA